MQEFEDFDDIYPEEENDPNYSTIPCNPTTLTTPIREDLANSIYLTPKSKQKHII